VLQPRDARARFAHRVQVLLERDLLGRVFSASPCGIKVASLSGTTTEALASSRPMVAARGSSCTSLRWRIARYGPRLVSWSHTRSVSPRTGAHAHKRSVSSEFPPREPQSRVLWPRSFFLPWFFWPSSMWHGSASRTQVAPSLQASTRSSLHVRRYGQARISSARFRSRRVQQ